MIRIAPLLLLFCSTAICATVPAGTRIEIRLTKPLNSKEATPMQVVEAVVIAPVALDGTILVAQGVQVLGHVKEVTTPLTAGDQAVLVLTFDRLRAGAKSTPFSARLLEVDNARETVDKEGRLLGIKASDTASARMDQGIGKVVEKSSTLGEILGGVKQAIVKEPDSSINYPAGVEMSIQVTEPFNWTGPPRHFVGEIQGQNDLPALVANQPVVTYAAKPPKPSDIPNLMFLGTEEQILAAFEAAGWTRAEQLNRESKLETFRALAEDRGYKEAPVSTILLDGQPPELAFEKLNNTFSARHHLRIWRRPDVFNGSPVWVSAATHDTGISFSESNRTFIHKIDSHIDVERAKVVNDLLFTNLVKGLALVERDNAPKSAHNATGDALETDGRIAVLQF